MNRTAEGAAPTLVATLGTALIRTAGVSSGPLKLQLTLQATEAKRFSGSGKFPAPLLGFPTARISQRPNRPAGGGSKALDQRLGTIEDRESPLDVLQPGIVSLGRFLSQGLFGFSEFLN